MNNHASPRYTYSVPRLLPSFICALIGRPSSLSHDSQLLLQGAHPQPRVLNIENIPVDSPFVLTLNHYDRPGLGAWWGVATIASAVAARRTCAPRELHMMMAREWWYPSGIGHRFKQPLTRWLFGQIAKSYSIITLPPVIGNDEFRGEGTIAIRRAIAMTRGENPQLVGLAPEGRTDENLQLCQPPHGTGLFMLLLTNEKIPCLPVGLYEDADNIFTANFGTSYMLSVPRELPKAERDAKAACQVMIRIGMQLPERMWGFYNEEIKSLELCKSTLKPIDNARDESYTVDGLKKQTR